MAAASAWRSSEEEAAVSLDQVSGIIFTNSVTGAIQHLHKQPTAVSGCWRGKSASGAHDGCGCIATCGVHDALCICFTIQQRAAVPGKADPVLVKHVGVCMHSWRHMRGCGGIELGADACVRAIIVLECANETRTQTAQCLGGCGGQDGVGCAVPKLQARPAMHACNCRH
jgi:hypothetical protein